MYAKFIVSLHTFVYASANMHWSKEAKDTVWLMAHPTQKQVREDPSQKVHAQRA